MKKYSLLNIITGWVVFIIASMVYLSTIEPTASFWDCGEFISSAYKLEVGHPPGAPFFMLLANFIAQLAGSDITNIAPLVNSLSALASAFTILLLFWSITHLAKKLVISDNKELSTGNIIAILGAGIVGALAYTFTDTFWFSAAEGEVYATSSLFTALVFYAILKWENVADQPFANKWLVFIAYLMGLSIGVHLLNLLAIPAIVLVFYFKKYEVSRQGVIKALIVSAIILGSIMYIIIPGVVWLASLFELFFVNAIGLSYHSGVIIYVLVLFGTLTWGLVNSYQKKKVILNTVLLCITVIILGYSSYALIMIRSNANPPMDQNNPEHLFNLLSYLNREQYGDRPLLYGQYYSAPVDKVKDGKPDYIAKNGKYKITYHKPKYVYDDRFNTIFPRMYSTDAKHVQLYEEWGKIKGTKIQTRNRNGEPETLTKPNFVENLRFFFRYQIGHMYIRYFMWNFAGRQNDIQSHRKYEITKGNWISGIKFMDEWRLGDQDHLPARLKNHKARNTYYFLPLILGILGIIVHYKKKKTDAWIVFTLFFMTGIAIVIYLNQNPMQPRERDYAYAGSFYAFSIWIGLGVIYVYNVFKNTINTTIAAGIATLIGTIVPVILAIENWDDHDRSNRYFARDFAYNYLNSCEKNAILFTNGDNDTFPLWYAQEVEGIRTDVRVVNLSYLGADWYIEQMERKVYDSDPLPMSLTKDKYVQGKRDIVYLIERLKGYTNLKRAIDFVADDDPRTKRIGQISENVDHLPNKRFSIPVDKEKVLANGTVPPQLADQIVPELTWTINRNYLIKNHLMVLDFLANNNWERPIYYAITVSSDNYLNLEKYFQVNGLAYRITPVYFKNNNAVRGYINTAVMYDKLIHVFRWGGIENDDIFVDENVMRMFTNFRNSFGALADALIMEGKDSLALQVLDRCMEVIPNDKVHFDVFSTALVEGYFKINDREKALELLNTLSNNVNEELIYYSRIDSKYYPALDYDIRVSLHVLNELSQIAGRYNEDELKQQLEQKFRQYLMALNPQV